MNTTLATITEAIGWTLIHFLWQGCLQPLGVLPGGREGVGEERPLGEGQERRLHHLHGAGQFRQSQHKVSIAFQAAKRMAERLGDMERDSDELLKEIASQTYKDGGYPFDIL